MLQNGTLKLTVTTGEIIIDKEGNQIVAIKDEQIDIEDGSIVTLAQVKDGKVEFISNENSDTDGSFKFQVGDGEGNFSKEYTTKIIVNAVADASDVSIELTKIETKQAEKVITVGENLNASKSNGKDGNDGSSHTIQLKEPLNSVNINVSKLENGEVRFFNGTEPAGVVAITGISASYTPDSSFTSFEVVNLGGQGKGTAAFKFDSYGYKSNIEGTDVYELKLEAEVTDDNESLSNVSLDASILPQGSKIFDLLGNKLEPVDGKYNISVENGEAKVKLESPIGSDTDGIQASATSTDSSTDGGTEGISNAISFAGGGDIDLSNLKDIVNLKEINLDNGKENNITDLKLDDLLNLEGDGNKIKITGDEFDGVTFKANDGWKTENTVFEDNKTLVEWTNTEDSTVSVKVEQPISDDITS